MKPRWRIPTRRVRGSLAVVACAGFLLLDACAGAVPATPAPQLVARTVYLVRHAEKGTEPANDPPLTAAGQARAAALAVVLADADVRSIVTTQLRRTQETARPLADRRAITPQVVGVTGAAREHAAEVARAVRAQPAGAVLVVGHSNTIPLIIEALGGPVLPAICDAVYANLYVVQLGADGRVALARTEYGTRTGTAAECGGMAP